MPSQIRLRAGVLQAPPFAFIDEDPVTQELQFRGFHVDLIERMKRFALELDNVALQVDFDRGPPHYATAVDVVANDCNTTQNPNPQEDCQAYDLILGDFYSTAERFLRVDFTPPWLKTAISTLKYTAKEDGTEDLITLKEAEAAKASVCVPKLSYLGQLVEQHIPGTIVINCDGSEQECVRALKNGTCALFADDALLLHFRASKDPTLEVTREQFRSQYLVWPMKHGLEPMVSMLMKRWMYEASNTGVLDELYHKYFQKELCPVGTAGENCELPCDPDHGTADANGNCVCRSIKWTGNDCSIKVQEETHMLPHSIVAVCYSLVGITFVAVMCCASWVIKNRKRAQVKMAQPSFLLLILIGCVISTSTIIALAQEDEGEGPVHACMAIPWLYSVGFSLTFGVLFAKIQRIYKLMESAAEMKRLTVSATETVRTVGLVLAIDVCILTVWTILDPLRWERITTSTDQFGEAIESQGFCTSEHWMTFTGVIASFHLILMGVGCYMCYLARSIPERFSNGKYISIAMFSNLQILIVAIPVLIILGSDPVSSFFIRSLAIWINDFVVVSLIFGNLIFQVYKWDRDNKLSRITSTISIRADIHNYAKKAKNSKNDVLDDCDSLSMMSISSSRQRANRQAHENTTRVPGKISPTPSAGESTIVGWLETMKKNSGQVSLDDECSLSKPNSNLPVLNNDGKQSDVISVLSSTNSTDSDDEKHQERNDVDATGDSNAFMVVIPAPRMTTDTEEDSSEQYRDEEAPIHASNLSGDAGLVLSSCNADVLYQRSLPLLASEDLEEQTDIESTQVSQESLTSGLNLQPSESALEQAAQHGEDSKLCSEDCDLKPGILRPESPLSPIKQWRKQATKQCE